MAGVLIAASAPLTLAQSAPVQVSFYYGVGGRLGKLVQSMVATFNRTHPHIKVVASYEGSYTGGGPEQQKLELAMAAGAPPAVAQMEVHSIRPFTAAHALVALNKFMNRSPHDKVSDFMPGMLLSGEYHGLYYAVPFNRSVPLLYYNTAMFKAAHISGPPTTWQQLAADAKKLTHGSGASKVYGYEPIVQWWQWESEVLSNGGKIFNHAGTKALFATPQAELGTLIQYQLLKDGYARANSGSHMWGDTVADFAAGKTAMYDGSAADMGSIQAEAAPSVKNHWAAALLPGFPNHRLVLPPGGGNLVLFAKQPKAVINAAWTFVEWLTAAPQQAYWSEHTGYMPGVKAALNIPSYKAYLASHPQLRVPIEGLKYQGVMPLNRHYIQVMGYVQEGMTEIFNELKPVAPVIAQVAKRADGIL